MLPTFRRLELVAVFRAHGLRLPLRDDVSVELWSQGRNHCIGAVNGETLRFLVQHHLAQAALQTALAQDLEHELARIETDVPLRPKSLPRPILDPDRQAELRQLRRTRRGIPHRRRDVAEGA